MLQRIGRHASPAMIVAIVAIVVAMTGSAFAARSLLTGADIKDGSITKADLAPSATASAKKAKRGPRGHRGPQGEQGEQGDPGLIGPAGERGPTGATGPEGPVGPPGSTGAKGAKGDQGDPGQDGAQGPIGQVIENNTTAGPTAIATPLAISSTGPTDNTTEGVEVSNGGFFLTANVRYLVHVSVSFVDTNPADAVNAEYGVGRLFLDASPLNGNGSGGGGSADGDTTLVTADIPDDTNNAAQASGSFLITAGDNGGGGEQLTLQGAVRGDEADGADVTARVIVTRVG